MIQVQIYVWTGKWFAFWKKMILNPSLVLSTDWFRTCCKDDVGLHPSILTSVRILPPRSCN